MVAILLAILPVFLLIFFGYGLRARKVLAEGFWAPAERLTYIALLPALLVKTLAEADLVGLAALPMAAALCIALLAMTALLLLARPLLGLDGPAFTSLLQGVLRQNTYVGLAVAAGLYGTEGLAAAALAVAVIVPLTNVICVVALARFAKAPDRRRSGGAAGPFIEILRNPLILACLGGIALNFSGFGLPPVLDETLAIMARAALPLGLLAVGAGLDLSALRGDARAVALALVLKLMLLPVMTAVACWALGVNGVAAFAAILFNGLPTATSTYILARQLGGDARLMASIVTLQVIAAVVTLPLIVGLLT